jgi:hypothetical protein
MVNMNMMGQMPGVQDPSEMAMQQAMAAQQQAQLQARGMQQPTYQTNGVNPAFAAVTDGAMGNIEARNKSMQGLI